MTRRITIIVPALTAIGILALGCGTDPQSGDNRQGSTGASCQTTNDCKAPLECIGNVCLAVGDASALAADSYDPGDVSEPDDAVGDPADFYVPDYGPPPTPDAVFETLADYLDNTDPGAPTDSGPGPELPDGQLNPISDCEGLGVADAWEGSFTGFVAYEAAIEIPGALPQDTPLPVEGDIVFEIQCIEQKLVVLGEMTGLALDQYPFELTLQGGYNPESGVLAAKMVDGKVDLFPGIIAVLFEGDFTGTLQGPESFKGTWEGESVGTDPPGLPGTAWGDGQWEASPK